MELCNSRRWQTLNSERRKLALVFPGQGCQRVGMGKKLADDYEEAEQVFQKVDKALGFPLSELCFFGPEEDLTLTRYAQPAIVATSVAAYVIMKSKGVAADIVSGHSVGEYSALVASGSLSLEDAVRLVHIRGRLMETAYPPGAGGMSAVLGLDKEKVALSCEAACGAGWIEPANYNSPRQIVISGDMAGLKKAGELCLAAGAKRVIPLKVSGPFHSRLMESAKSGLERELEKTEFRKPSIPVVMNVDGMIAECESKIRRSLARQISEPVLWEDCVRKMYEFGAGVFAEAGPGRVLTGLIRQIEPLAETFVLDGSTSMDDTVKCLEEVLRNENGR
jgi:[acyl-carrier-protein] S-malonyltransferase